MTGEETAPTFTYSLSNHPLRGRLMRRENEQFCERRPVRIDVLIVQDPRIDQLITGLPAST
jgi:hypothetical protein